MFEYTKVQALLVGLQTPGDGVTGGDINPPNNVALQYNKTRDQQSVILNN